MLIDSYGRQLTYARIALTDKCNLRCTYCMPESGLNWLKNDMLLSTDELKRLLTVLREAGIEKIRFTGGEPTLRKDFESLVQFAFDELAFPKVSLTTNGTFSEAVREALIARPWHSINFSLDSLDAATFQKITLRESFESVYNNLMALINARMNVRVNMVMLDSIEPEHIQSMIELTRKSAVHVRFIEEMPFNGKQYSHGLKWNALHIQNEIKKQFPSFEALPFQPGATSQEFASPDFAGTVGIIAAFSRTFCGTCNRLRITPEGAVKTCLYAPSSLSLRQLLREGRSNEEIIHALEAAVLNKPKDGFAAEEMQSLKNYQSMATVGG